jgi:hypothetical protein
MIMLRKPEIEVVAVDFDGTIATSGYYPTPGDLIPEAREVMLEFYKQGGRIIIWTCRIGHDLTLALKFLQDYDIPFDAVNSNLEYRIRRWNGMDGRKVGADLYLDDKTPGFSWKKARKAMFYTK